MSALGKEYHSYTLCFASQLNFVWICETPAPLKSQSSSSLEFHLLCFQHTITEFMKFPMLSEIYSQANWEENWSQIFEGHSTMLLKIFSLNRQKSISGLAI